MADVKSFTSGLVCSMLTSMWLGVIFGYGPGEAMTFTDGVMATLFTVFFGGIWIVAIIVEVAQEATKEQDGGQK